MTTFHAFVRAIVLAALPVISVCSGQAVNEPSSPDTGTGGPSEVAPQPEKVPAIMRLAGEKFDLRRAIRLQSSQFASRHQRVEDLDRELAANAADRKRLDALREEANRLRGEIKGDAGEQSQAGEGSAESAEEAGFFNRFSRWLNARYSEPSQGTQNRREAAQVDELLRSQGVTLEIDGEQRTERFDSLAQLEAILEEQTRALDTVARQNLENRNLAAEELEKHNAEAERLQAALDAVESRINAEAEKIPQFTPATTTEFGELLDAIAEGFNAQPSEPATPGTTETTPTSDSAATGGAGGHLMQGLAGDLMTPSEYQQRIEQRSQANPVVDEETRRQAATINQQLAVTEAALAEAERRHQQLVQQNAQAEQIRRAWAQQEAIRGQWLQQQYLQQNFSQAVQQALGGSRSSASGGSPTVTRSGGPSGSSSIQRQTGSSSGNRRGGNAAGFDDLLQPVKDPARAQQLQETFGNRNRKK